MALEDLTPAVREEAILDGADIDPATRLEYFLKKAANEVPKPTGVSDAGKVVTVNEDGDGFELDDVPKELPSYTSADKGKFLGLGEGSSSTTEVIVPEQTGEFIADFGIGKGFTVSNPNLAFFQSAELGDTCEAIVGGSSYTLTYANYNGTLAFLDGSMIYALVPIYVDTEVEWVEFVSTTAAIHDTATISATASVPSVEPKWEAVGEPTINVTHTMVIDPPNPPSESYDVVTPAADVSSIIASGKTCRVIITDSNSGNINELIMVNNGSGLSSVITTGLTETGVALKVDEIYVEDGDAIFYSSIVDVSGT